MHECIIVGGGIAGLQAAIQLGRYKHRVLVIDNEHGRSSLCRAYHNVLGWPDGVSGQELRSLGRRQAQALGIEFVRDLVVKAEEHEGALLVHTESHGLFRATTLLLATGIMDRLPPLPQLLPCLGLTVYVCPDCDGFEVAGRRTIVLGSGNTGAQMALTLTYWTSDIIYINHEQQKIDLKRLEQLAAHRIERVDAPISEILCESEGIFSGVKLADGREIRGDRGFIAFGGNEVRTSLAEQLGIKLADNKHIEVDPRTKMTSLNHVWAAGDINVHSEQLTIAMGDGAQAAIWIHKTLLQLSSTS